MMFIWCYWSALGFSYYGRACRALVTFSLYLSYIISWLHLYLSRSWKCLRLLLRGAMVRLIFYCEWVLRKLVVRLS